MYNNEYNNIFKNKMINFIIILKHLNICLDIFILEDIFGYLSTHCGAILTFDKAYSHFNNYLCKNTPTHYIPIVHRSYLGIIKHCCGRIHKKKFLNEKLYIIVCKDHTSKDNVKIPDIYNTNGNNNEERYTNNPNEKIYAINNICYALIKKIDFLINRKKNIERKLPKNEESNNKKRELLKNEESNNKKRKLN